MMEKELQEAKQQTALKSNGIYSVMNKKWIKEPVAEDIPELDEEAFDKLFKEWEDRYFDIIENPTVETIENFIEDIYDLRKTSIANEGEYSLGNLVFKEFRNLTYLDNLRDIKKELKDKELSLENLNESTFRNGNSSVSVDTGLRGELNFKLMESIIGQLSDGMWENSRQAEKYWRNMRPVMLDDEKVIMEVWPYLFDGNHDDEDDNRYSDFGNNVRKYLATKLKQIVKEAAKYKNTEKDFPIKWDRNCNYEFDGFFHGKPTVRDIYKAYDKLLGRANHFEDRTEIVE